MSKHLKSGNNKKHFTLRPTRATVRISSVTQTFNGTKNISKNCWEKLNTHFLENVKAAETVSYVNTS